MDIKSYKTKDGTSSSYVIYLHDWFEVILN